MTAAMMPIAKVCDHYKGRIGRDRVYRLVRAGHLRSHIVNGKYQVECGEVQRLDRLLSSNSPLTLKDASGIIINKVTV